MPDRHPLNPSAPALAVSAIDAALARGGAQGALLVPSSPATLKAVSKWAADGVAVVGRVPGTVSPQALLSLVDGGQAKRPHTGIIFSDQLVSPVDAPLLIQRGGNRRYVSALELLCHTRHGFPVSAWTGASFEPAPPGCEPDELLSLLVRYLEACDGLGNDWLMRDAQAECAASHRLNDARRRLQLFQSVILHSFSETPLPTEYEGVVRRLAEMRKSLGATARVA